jgi:acyl-CoA thioesterase FadM
VVVEIGKVKLTFDYRVVRAAGGKLIATARTIHACTDLQEKPQGLPETLRVALERQAKA